MADIPTLNPGMIFHSDPAVQNSLRSLADAISDRKSCCMVNDSDIWRHAGEYACNPDYYAGLNIDGLLKPARLVVRSSGTTNGVSKQIVYDIDRFLEGMHVVAGSLQLSAHHLGLSLVNPRFIYGLSVVISHAMAGETARLFENAGQIKDFDLPAASAVDIYMTPAQAISFLLADIRFPESMAVRFLFAGDKLAGPVAQRIARQYPSAVIANMYGQVELGPRVAIRETPARDYVEGNVGKPLNGVSVKIVNPDESGQGALWVQSRFQMLGYLTAGPLDEASLENWVDTGDIAQISPNGDLLITGRAGRHVNLAGHRIDLKELEMCVLSTGDIVNCKAKTNKSNILGTRISLVIQTLQDINDQDARDLIIRQAKKQLERDFHELSQLIEIEMFSNYDSKEGAGKI